MKGHKFHQNCLETWLTKGGGDFEVENSIYNKCPICR